ncbi:MAG: FIST C-terminal domain-containing protein, partial [Cyclobacteriaceae bacterium]|nr:FIST C-terminal domain-containing protein [Cyclobacteriaceae bacterium]
KETKGIMVPRGIPEGSKFRFTLPPDFDVIDKVIQSARDIKKEGLDSADAEIIFSCIGRLMTLGPLVNEEIKGLTEVWRAPMAGFFSYGEFGSAPGGTPDFIGTSCSWVALKEK